MVSPKYKPNFRPNFKLKPFRTKIICSACGQSWPILSSVKRDCDTSDYDVSLIVHLEREPCDDYKS